MINEGESGEVKNDEGLGAQAFSLSLSPPLVLRRVPRVALGSLSSWDGRQRRRLMKF